MSFCLSIRGDTVAETSFTIEDTTEEMLAVPFGADEFDDGIVFKVPMTGVSSDGRDEVHRAVERPTLTDTTGVRVLPPTDPSWEGQGELHSLAPIHPFLDGMDKTVSGSFERAKLSRDDENLRF